MLASNLKPKILANAEFSKDMVDTMSTHFDSFSKDGTLTLQVTDMGIWIANPAGGVLFLGAMSPIKKH